MKLNNKIAAVVIGLSLTSAFSAKADGITDGYIPGLEARLTRDWQALNSQQRNSLRYGERLWIKWKDSLCIAEQGKALENRVGFLESYKAGNMADADGYLVKQGQQQERVLQWDAN